MSASIDEPPRYGDAKPLPDGWEIGDLLPGPLAYIKLPPHRFTHATARYGELSFQVPPRDAYSSRPLHRDLTVERARYDVQHQPGKGWPKPECGHSKFHPKGLDYRTVDELGLPVEQLDEQRLPRTQVAKHQAEQLVDAMVVEGAELLRESEGIMHTPSIELEPSKPVTGEIKAVVNKKVDTQYSFYHVTVPQRDVPVGLLVCLKKLSGMGDPDIFVCNRNSFPQVAPHEHTWRSQDAGDDEIFIPPHDPFFFPGPFYISVYALKEAAFEITVHLIEHRVKLRPPMPAEGNGFREVRRCGAAARGAARGAACSAPPPRRASPTAHIHVCACVCAIVLAAR